MQLVSYHGATRIVALATSLCRGPWCDFRPARCLFCPGRQEKSILEPPRSDFRLTPTMGVVGRLRRQRIEPNENLGIFLLTSCRITVGLTDSRYSWLTW